MKSSPEKGNAPGGRSPEALIEANHLAEESNMSDFTQVNVSRAITVSFHGADLYVVEHKKEPYTPMKPIVEGMGIDWKGQHAKLSANPARWGMEEISIPSAGGMQVMSCLPLRKLFGWMTGLHVGKIKAELRPAVMMYQNECDDVLWKYWSEGVAVNARATQPVQATLDYDRISPAQAQDLKQIVQAIVDAGIQKYAETWARLQRKFKVHSYLALHPDQYEAARAYLIAKLPNGYAPEVDEDFKQGTLRPFDGVAMRAARQVAMGFMTSTYQAAKAGLDTPPMANLPSEVLTGVLANALVQQRFLAFFNAECCLQLKPMSDGAVVIDFESADLDTIAQAVPMARLAALMEALSRRTQTHLDAFGSYLTRAGGVQLM